ncbi:MAG: hypothetical protein M9962_13895 [Oligoflexia bacterium]|nr:hypothetical protein [Oligoflexia bacterium]
MKQGTKTTSELAKIAEEIKKNLQIPSSAEATKQIIDSIISKNKINQFERKKLSINKLIHRLPIRFLKDFAEKELFCSLEEPHPLIVGRELKRDGYYCYETALFCLGLTKTIAKPLFLAKERPGKNPEKVNYKFDNEKLREEFSKSPRLTNNIAVFKKIQIHLLEREGSKNTGVIEVKLENGQNVKTTDPARTLIDCAIAPHYSGGPRNVKKIFHILADKVKIEEFINTYLSLNLSYPYWQRIGFYLQQTSVNAEDLKKFKMALGPISNKFFLDKEFTEHWKYSDEWQLYYPDDL